MGGFCGECIFAAPLPTASGDRAPCHVWPGELADSAPAVSLGVVDQAGLGEHGNLDLFFLFACANHSMVLPINTME